MLRSVSLIGQLITLPLLLHNYTKHEYTIWIIANAFAAFMLVSDSGIIQGFTTAISSQHSLTNHLNGNLGLKARKWLTFNQLSLGILLLLILSLGVANTNPIAHESKLVILLMIGNVLSVAQHYLLMIFQFKGKYSHGVLTIGIYKAIEVSLLTFLLALHFGLQIVAFSILLSRSLSVLHMFLTSRGLSWNFEICSDTGNLKNSITAALSMNAAVLFANQGILVVLGSWASDSQIIFFTLGRMFLSPIRILADSSSLGMFSDFLSRNGGRNDSLNPLRRVWYFYLLSTLYFLFFMVVQNPIVSRFFHDQITHSPLQLAIFLVSTCLDGAISFYFQVYLLNGRGRMFGATYLLLTIVYLIVGLVLIHNVILVLFLNILCDIATLLIAQRLKEIEYK